MLAAAVHLHLVQPSQYAVLQMVAQNTHASALLRHLLHAQFSGLAHADDARNVQSARAHSTLMTAAVDLG